MKVCARGRGVRAYLNGRAQDGISFLPMACSSVPHWSERKETKTLVTCSLIPQIKSRRPSFSESACNMFSMRARFHLVGKWSQRGVLVTCLISDRGSESWSWVGLALALPVSLSGSGRSEPKADWHWRAKSPRTKHIGCQQIEYLFQLTEVSYSIRVDYLEHWPFLGITS